MQYVSTILPFFLAGVGLWLILPRGAARGKWIGVLCGLAALSMIAWHVPRLVNWLDESVFGALAVTTIVACAAAISAKDPLYSAIWFGLALLGTAGLFLLVGAQFLAVATITVYAGAILVTFLFVIMLAQPQGHAHYDRLSWEALLSAAAGSILIGLLTSAIGHVMPDKNEIEAVAATPLPDGTSELADASSHQDGVLAKEHVATFGRELLGKHLVAMQAAGALMLAALVGAVAIVAHGRQDRRRTHRGNEELC